MNGDYLIAFLIFISIAWVLSVVISGNLFSPASVFAFMFFFSGLSILYSRDNWGFQMHPKTFQILVAGIVTYLGVSFYVEKLYELRHPVSKIKKHMSAYRLEPIEITSWNAILLTLVVVIISVFFLIMAVRTAGGGLNLATLASRYRNAVVHGGKQMSFLGRLAFVILRALSMSIAIVALNNLFAKCFWENQGFWLILCTLVYIGTTLLSGERTSLFKLIGVFVLCYGVFWQRSNNYKRLIGVRYILLTAIAGIVVIYGFSWIRFFVGRKSNLNLFDYISLYAGGSIYNLDHFVRSPNLVYAHGLHTFIGIQNNLARLGFGTVKQIHREVVAISSKKIYMGNVYTCFYDYYADFGLAGVIIMTAIFAVFISWLYCRAKYNRKNKAGCCLTYVFFGTTLFFASFTEQFYTTYLAVSTVEIMVIMHLALEYLKARQVGFLTYRIQRN